MKHIEWGFLIVNYLFLGGLSAGLAFVSAAATLIQRGEDTPEHTRVARWGALAAPWPVAIGCTLLIFDLGRGYAFWKLFLHFRWTSPMSIGSWLLVGFTLMALLNCWIWLTEELRERVLAWVPGRLRSLPILRRDFSNWQRPLAVVAIPMSAAVGIYTGVLLGAVQSRPFWNTNLVAQMFLFSAFSTGCAALIVMLAIWCKPLTMRDLRLVCALDVCFLTLELFIVLPYIIHGHLSSRAVEESMVLILGGPFTITFWVFFLGLGLLLPLIVEVREVLPVLLSRPAGQCNRIMAAATAILILGGGFLLRYIFVFAGQMSRFS
jgi:formate-dependent nitrite reductase membrane component NrfD